MYKCKKCFIEFTKWAEEFVPKLCENCHQVQICRYKIQLLHSGNNVCGGIDVYQIIPNPGIINLRLHHIVNTRNLTNNHTQYEPFTSIATIINAVEGWNIDPPFNFNKLDRINKGIIHSNGNGIIAALETSGRGGIKYYLVEGVWG